MYEYMNELKILEHDYGVLKKILLNSEYDIYEFDHRSDCGLLEIPHIIKDDLNWKDYEIFNPFTYSLFFPDEVIFFRNIPHNTIYYLIFDLELQTIIKPYRKSNAIQFLLDYFYYALPKVYGKKSGHEKKFAEIQLVLYNYIISEKAQNRKWGDN